MKHLLRIKDLTFSVSDAIINAITKNDLSLGVIYDKEEKIHVLDYSCLPNFTIFPTKSSTHTYVEIRYSGKLRVSRPFFEHIALQTNQDTRVVEKTPSLQLLDKFYTKSEMSKACVDAFTSSVKIKKRDLIVEPSAGNRSFIKPLEKLGCDNTFLDIAPENGQIKQANFLEWQPPKTMGKIHVIGNPPFGRHSAMCFKFIDHASKFADSISFILPISFKKESKTSRIPANFHLISEFLLPKRAFLRDGQPVPVPTVFQVWQKRRTLRKMPKKNTPEGFEFVKKSQACLCIRRTAGSTGNAGYATTQLKDKEQNRHFFIKVLNGVALPELVGKINKTSMVERDFCLGVPSINRQELTHYLNGILKKSGF
jgi:hypothetical protein